MKSSKDISRIPQEVSANQKKILADCPMVLLPRTEVPTWQ
nr:MAG TPA: hypothetical protein [Bacteriophage sp.]